MGTATIEVPPQICFVNEEGLMVCNYIVRNGKPVFTKSGKRFKFRPRGQKKPVARA